MKNLVEEFKKKYGDSPLYELIEARLGNHSNVTILDSDSTDGLCYKEDTFFGRACFAHDYKTIEFEFTVYGQDMVEITSFGELSEDDQAWMISENKLIPQLQPKPQPVDSDLSFITETMKNTGDPSKIFKAENTSNARIEKLLAQLNNSGYKATSVKFPDKTMGIYVEAVT